MARTPSNMVALGTPAPDFHLPNVDGKTVSMADFDTADALLVMFLSNHCPFVKHIQKGLVDLGRDYQNSKLAIVAVASNDIENYPEDGPEFMREEAAKAGYKFPYLFDSTQAIARAYDAACTPDFFLYDRARRLVYRGQFDESRPGNSKPVSGADLRAAITDVLAGKTPNPKQIPSLGCNIKWKGTPD